MIKQNKSGDSQMGGDQGLGGSLLPGGQFAMRNVPLKTLLGFAFYPSNQMFRNDYIIGAPSWVDSDRFDVIGKAPADLPARACFFSNSCRPDTRLALMLEAFLVKQFHMVTHQEQKLMKVYALAPAKGGAKLNTARFHKAAAHGERNCRRIAGGTGDPDAKDLDVTQAGFVCANITMGDLANLLPEMAPVYLDRPVLDATGLEGAWDFKLTWVPRALIDLGGLTVLDALEKQLGLKLESRKQPMTVTVIDHIEKLDN